MKTIVYWAALWTACILLWYAAFWDYATLVQLAWLIVLALGVLAAAHNYGVKK